MFDAYSLFTFLIANIKHHHVIRKTYPPRKVRASPLPQAAALGNLRKDGIKGVPFCSQRC